MHSTKTRSFLKIIICTISLAFGLQSQAIAGDSIVEKRTVEKRIAEKGTANSGFIAIIMDDLGSGEFSTERLIHLPAQLTYSFLPHTPYSEKLARHAHGQGKEVMLHLPMEAIGHKHVGRGGLTLNMNQKRFVSTLREAIHSIPFAVGINNHMGSSLTRSVKNMHWLMQELKSQNNLYFVDSRTHRETVAAQIANRNHLKHASRDIFLDHVVEKQAIDDQFERLLNRAKFTGYALAIGHPHKLTIQALERWIDIIKKQGIKIVPVSEYIYLTERERLIRQASLVINGASLFSR